MISNVTFTGSEIISDVDLPFDSGLNVITGETGTGKTVLINLVANALGFSMPIPFYLRSGQLQVTVDLEYAQHSVLLQFGGSRKKTFLDGEQVSQKELRNLFKGRVVLSSQFDAKILDSPEELVYLLDSFAQLEELRETYSHLFSQMRELDIAIKRVREQLSQSAKVSESLRSELEELRNFNPRVGEYEELKNQLLRANQRERIVEDTKIVLDITEDDAPFMDGLKKLRNALSMLSAFYPEAKELLELSDSLRAQIQSYRANASEPEEELTDIDSINERLYHYEKYFRTYGYGEQAILDRLNQLNNELIEIERLPEKLADLMDRKDKLQKDLLSTGKELSSKRKTSLNDSLASVQTFLSETGVDGTFYWNWVQAENNPIGLEVPEIGVMRSGEMVSVSSLSGGERNRVLLALRTILSLPKSVLIFDEPDAGLGGETLSRLVKLLQNISQTRQIILITHNPQVAAAAQKHFSVERILSGDKIRVKIELLQDQRRIHEIAKMIAGQYVTATTLELASELVRQLSGGESFGEVRSGN
ncbi:AAA family ATPase [Coprothermobacter platensis]|uniref:AAA family ATPase n=1 Tax=Coprothermobacter platensis TaxID=108819 RepID=UPI00036B5C46|nr:AAA family ATPase [Coprothermobacter platensis]